MSYEMSVAGEGRHVLHVDDAGKAVVTFQMDFWACRFCIGMCTTPKRIPGTGRLDVGGPERAREMFVHALALTEFFLNRVVPLSDKAMDQMMVHARFSLAHILGVSPCGGDDALAADCAREASFRNIGGRNDELRHISHVDYDAQTVADAMDGCGGTAGAAGIEERLGIAETCARYYDRILSDMLGETAVFRANTDGETARILGIPGTESSGKEASVPLFPLVEALASKCAKSPMLSFHTATDLADMRAERFCEDDALMGVIRWRDMEAERLRGRLSEACAAHEAALTGMSLFVRVLKCVLSRGSIEKDRVFVPAFETGCLLRMLDPDLFGRRYVCADMYVRDLDLLARYTALLNFLDNAHSDAMIRLDALKAVDTSWTYSNRLRGTSRFPSVMCRVGRPVMLKQKDLAEPEGGVLWPKKNPEPPAILAVTAEERDEVISILAPRRMRPVRNNLACIVVVDPSVSGPRVRRNRDSDDVAEVTVPDLDDLFDVHTEYALQRAADSAKRHMEMASGNTGDELLDRVDAETAAFCRELLDDLAGIADDVGPDYRRHLGL
ncbi:MAG: hypothetical protein Q4Q62_05470 [Thermoplasmata archaeon]|nr:hypothetical protein [Thermoplasmata archaeon]